MRVDGIRPCLNRRCPTIQSAQDEKSQLSRPRTHFATPPAKLSTFIYVLCLACAETLLAPATSWPATSAKACGSLRSEEMHQHIWSDARLVSEAESSVSPPKLTHPTPFLETSDKRMGMARFRLQVTPRGGFQHSRRHPMNLLV